MEITDVEAIPIETPIKSVEEPDGIAPYVTHTGTVESARSLLIRLETDADITGWGEMMLETSPEVAVSVIESELAPHVVGRSVWEIESVRSHIDHYYIDIESLLGAVEMAMLDAFGKYLEVPLYELIGGKCSNTVELAYCIGILPPDKSAERAKHIFEKGYKVIKTKGDSDWRRDVRRLQAMDEAVNDNIEFRIDPNQAWSFEDAVRAGTRLENAGIYTQYLEQPVRIDTYGTYKQLRSRLRQPIGINDDTYKDHNLYQYVKNDAIDVGVVDIITSGIIGMKKMAGVANASGISLSHHNGFDLGIKTAAVLHVVSSTPEFNLPIDTTYYSWDKHIIKNPFKDTNAEFTVPDGPGLGITVDEKAIRRQRITVDG